MTIHDYFNLITNRDHDIDMTEEFNDAIIDMLEVIKNHPLGDFENKIEEEDYEDEPTDEEMMSSFGTKWHDGL